MSHGLTLHHSPGMRCGLSLESIAIGGISPATTIYGLFPQELEPEALYAYSSHCPLTCVVRHGRPSMKSIAMLVKYWLIKGSNHCCGNP